MKAFWMQLIEKLSEEDGSGKAVAAAMADITAFLGFEKGFVYNANYDGLFILSQNFERTQMPYQLNLERDSQFLKELATKKLISARTGRQNSELGEYFLGAFQTQGVLVVPILGDEREVLSFVGMLGIKEEEKYQSFDSKFAYELLVVVVNSVRLNIYQRDIKRTKKALSSIADNMGVDIYVNDFQTHEILYINRSMAAPYGGVDAMEGKVCWQALYDDKTSQCEYCPQLKIIDKEGKPTKIYSWNYQRPFDGSWFRVLSGAFEWTDGRTAHLVSSIDITEDKRNETIVQRLAEFDTLTNLANRRKLYKDCFQYIQEGKEIGLLFFDIDRFKQVNDIYGHRAGDELLKQLGIFLQESNLTKERSYRYGGDEFVIICNQGEEMEIAKFIEGRFKEEWFLATGSVKCPSSIGISRYPQDGDNVTDLIAHADQGMYQSKSSVDSKIH